MVATHANVGALVDIARNLSDEGLDAIGAHCGRVMLTPNVPAIGVPEMRTAVETNPGARNKWPVCAWT